ncbi:hypothetical protein BDY19DRAFT_998220 [Irpex rosettiformis]|uniref:Uncharacterized protein n=1 Tax=Irpex rosettiformis TaxID=378272 RepID=A0ACB8TP79_9APHY|nr:hypothetical protein BDY19DRAFT_998220 [Irpex rosettiformis]
MLASTSWIMGRSTVEPCMTGGHTKYNKTSFLMASFSTPGGPHPALHFLPLHSCVLFSPWSPAPAFAFSVHVFRALEYSRIFLKSVSNALLSLIPGMEPLINDGAQGSPTYLDFASTIWVSTVDEADAAYERYGKAPPEGSAEESEILDNLSIALQTRYKATGDLADLQEAIMLGTRILERTPDEDPAKPARMSNLDSAVLSRFDRLGNVTDLHTVVALKTRAVSPLSDDDPDLPFHLNNLGYALQLRFGDLCCSSTFNNDLS